MPDAAKVFLAIDLGASGGRVVAGLFDGQQARIWRRSIASTTAACQRPAGMYWPLLSLWQHVLPRPESGGQDLFRPQIASVGVDTWGVDFGLLGKNDELLGIPHHYRDRRTVGILEKAFAIVPRDRDFQGDRPAVHGVQHALSTAGDEAGQVAALDMRRVAS